MGPEPKRDETGLNGEEVSPSLDSGVWESVVSSPSGIRGSEAEPCRKWFYCNLISADRLCWQQVTANSSPFRPEKWRYCTPQSKKWGYRYPSYIRLYVCKLRLWYLSRYPCTVSWSVSTVRPTRRSRMAERKTRQCAMFGRRKASASSDCVSVSVVPVRNQDRNGGTI